ncbi:transposase [Streptomyces griseus]|uniref:transposase n=1 Tax=Streptomyces griseus TaxID=1911 RepID=UPI00099CACB0
MTGLGHYLTLYVLHNDIAWQLLLLELGFGSGQTCWRRVERWQQAGVFDQLHRVLIAELNSVGQLDWSRACVDGSHIRAKKGAPTPVRRRSTSPSSTASRPSPAAPAGPADDPRPCSATKATTPTPTATSCADAGSCPSSYGSPAPTRC